VRQGSPLAQRLPADLRYFRYREVVSKLQELAGIAFVRHDGPHEIWRTPQGGNLVIPRHPSGLATGTLKQIIKQAGLEMSVRQFIAS
jgi:predicted RNA binding protein YcfA (HicA-like mRNA interferase family)